MNLPPPSSGPVLPGYRGTGPNLPWWKNARNIALIVVGGLVAIVVVAGALNPADDDEDDRGGRVTMCQALDDAAGDLSSGALRSFARDLLNDLPAARRNVAEAQIRTVCPEYLYVLD